MRFPRDQWIAAGVAAESLPEESDVPDRVPLLYTTETPGNLNVFDTIQISAEGSDLDVKLIVVGAVEQTPNLLYALDPNTGQVLQFDPSAARVRGVNSSYRMFIACLNRLLWAMESAGTEDAATVLNTGMRYTLRAIDDAAFEAGAWWPLVFSRLGER